MIALREPKICAWDCAPDELLSAFNTLLQSASMKQFKHVFSGGIAPQIARNPPLARSWR
jgi:hypothetical protein